MNIRVDFAYLVGKRLTPDLKRSIERIAGPGLLQVYTEGEAEIKRLNKNRVNLTVASDNSIVDVWMG